MREKTLYALAALAGVLFIRNAYVILLHLPDEAEQGAIYRILFYHLPAFFTAALCYLSALGTSIAYLRTRNAIWDAYAAAATETGLAFAAINLVTGMVWAKIIWGVWWVWDARLTWALICWLVYFGYLMLRKAIDDPSERAKNSAVLSVFAFTSVAITWKAIEWWRTQHPGPVLSIRGGGGRMDPAMEAMIYWNWLPMLMLAAVFIAVRMRQEQVQREIDALRRNAHAI